jgi:hypothetical protein
LLALCAAIGTADAVVAAALQLVQTQGPARKLQLEVPEVCRHPFLTLTALFLGY